MSQSKNGKKPNNALSIPEIGKALQRKLKLSSQYKGGELDWLRDFRQRLGGASWRILRYQRVIEPEEALLPISQFAVVRPLSFERQMRQLQEECHIVPLEEIYDLLERGKPVPEKTVAVTFDCGWMDTFLYAFPILKDLQIPATVFVPTAFINTYDLFWPDKVLLSLMEMKRAKINIEPFEFFLPEVKEAFEDVSPDGEITLPLIFVMIAGLELSSPVHRSIGLGILGEIFNAIGGELPLDPLFLRWDEARIMEDFGITFASLGHSHNIVTELTPEKLREDLQISWQVLEQQLKRPLKIFSPPAGKVSEEYYQALDALQIKRSGFCDPSGEIFKTDAGNFSLRRNSLYEMVSSSPELFFCSLWDIPIEAG